MPQRTFRTTRRSAGAANTGTLGAVRLGAAMDGVASGVERGGVDFGGGWSWHSGRALGFAAWRRRRHHCGGERDSRASVEGRRFVEDGGGRNQFCSGGGRCSRYFAIAGSHRTASDGDRKRG